MKRKETKLAPFCCPPPLQKKRFDLTYPTLPSLPRPAPPRPAPSIATTPPSLPSIIIIIRLSPRLPPNLHQLQNLHPLSIRPAKLSYNNRRSLDDAHLMLESWDKEVEDEVVGVTYQEGGEADGGNDVPSQSGVFVGRGGAAGGGDEGADEGEGACETSRWIRVGVWKGGFLVN